VLPSVPSPDGSVDAKATVLLLALPPVVFCRSMNSACRNRRTIWTHGAVLHH
jgi:hypothetical protein